MPSSFTKNYQLSQWERSDKVQMEDFNADNAKIDAAIAAEATARAAAVQAARDACPLVYLKQVTLTQTTTQYDLDLTGFDWSAYSEISIHMLLKSTYVAGYFDVLLNGKSGTTYYYDVNHNLASESLFTILINNYVLSAVCKIPRNERGFRIEWRDNNYWSASRYMYSRLESADRSYFTTMNFVCQNSSAPLAAGTRFTVLGLRA